MLRWQNGGGQHGAENGGIGSCGAFDERVDAPAEVLPDELGFLLKFFERWDAVPICLGGVVAHETGVGRAA